MLIDKADPSEIQENEHFARIAAQLQNNVSPPQIRNALMDELHISRLSAGKLVEDVQKGVRMAKLNLLSGSVFWSLGAMLYIFVGGGLITWGLIVGGALQMSAGYRPYQAYRNATTATSG